MKKQFLMVGDRRDSIWIQTLERAIGASGQLEVVPESDLDQVDWNGVCLAFVEPGAAVEILPMIQKVRRYKEDLRVIVFTYNPSWKRALEAKDSGASHYVAKSQGEEELQKAIQTVLRSPVPKNSSCPTQRRETMKRPAILFVDDNLSFLQSRTRLLEQEGYQVTAVSSIEKARDAILEHHIDLAILDLRLEHPDEPADCSGLKLAGELSPSLPKIILTDYPSFEAARQALKLGPDGIPPAVDFVDKGKGMEALRPAIRRALGTDLAWLRSLHTIDDNLKHDYREAQGQARLMFGLSLVFISLGSIFLFTSLGVIISLIGKTPPNSSWMSPAAGLVTAIAGVIGQAAGVLIFRRLDAANARIEHYHDERLTGQRFETLLHACEDLGDEREKVRVQIVRAAAASWLVPCSGRGHAHEPGSREANDPKG